MSQADAGMPSGVSQHAFTSMTPVVLAEPLADDREPRLYVLASYDPAGNIVKVVLLLFLAIIALTLLLF